MRINLIAALIATLLIACGQASARSPQAAAEDAQTEIQTVLEDATTVARQYGQQHLGHYLKLDVAALEQLGLEYPLNVSIKVRTDHTKFCLIATHGGLDKSDPWRVASVSSTTQRVDTANSCGGR